MNFAQVLTDEMVIYVPHEDEEEGSISELWAETAEAEGGGATVDINTATEQDLQTLPASGPLKPRPLLRIAKRMGDLMIRQNL
ncbi:hypothetical protein [Geomicrobium sp. JCM 19039]|uniref:hypothetical protein n=1 Tax=Geomicrobium sp. JCM 19039 TaxID=1460636 RepID=UPI000693FD20|nr:hypothetical protein [Geomicrobium sp. JCM 19039]